MSFSTMGLKESLMAYRRDDMFWAFDLSLVLAASAVISLEALEAVVDIFKIYKF